MSDLEAQMVNEVLRLIRNANLPATSPQALPDKATAEQTEAAANNQAQQQALKVLQQLVTGQQYNATVVSAPKDGEAVIKLMDTLIRVATDAPLKEGQHLTIELADKTGQIALKIIQPATATDIKEAFLKIDLPRQIPLKTLITALAQLAVQIDRPKADVNVKSTATTLTNQTQTAKTDNQQAIQSKVIDTIRSLADALNSRVINPGDLQNPKRFQEILQNSGIMLERSLAAGKNVQHDLKANLLKMAEQLQQMVNAEQKQANSPKTDASVLSRLSAAVSNASSSALAPGPKPLLSPTTPPTSPTVAQQTQPQPSLSTFRPDNTVTQPIKIQPPAGNAETVRADPQTLIAASKSANILSSADKGQANQTTVPANAEPNLKMPNSVAQNALDALNANAKAGNKVDQLSAVTDKPGLTASQLAQRAIMSNHRTASLINGKAAEVQSALQLLGNQTVQQVLNLLPRTELNLLLKQLLFKKAMAENGIQTGTLKSAGAMSPLKQLLTAVESGLARLQTQQLASVPVDDATRQVWQFEIPLKNQTEISTLMMRIEQDDSPENKNTQGSTWTVALNIDMEELGHIHSKIRLTGEHVSTHFWADQQKTVSKISGQMERLSEALTRLGLKVEHMTASLGVPPDPVELVSIENHLLDEQA